MPDLKNEALSYAARGWAVFPIHTPTETGCSCRHADCSRIGKHPRISTGRNGATTDPAIISKWWDVWPDANIGIATGIESGLIVLDVDEGGEDTIYELNRAYGGEAIPETVEQITGSGGRHIFFKHPGDAKYKTRVRFLPGLDSRADGGYIVAPSSLHKSGKRYEWELSCHPDDVAIADAPEWFLEHLKANENSQLEVPEWNPDGELPENIMTMLEAIPADDYETWRNVGFALHHADPVDGLSVWDWWSSTSLKYDQNSVHKEWRNFARRQHNTANPVTLCTVRSLAEQHGWIDPDLEHGAKVAEQLLDSFQKQQAAEISESYQANKAPTKSLEAPDIMPKSGLIRDIAQRILKTSIRPQPRLAVIAATTFVGTLAGRKYQTETGLRTNVYSVGLAESGAGKDQARKEINNLASLAEVDGMIGGDRIASGPGVITALENSPSKLFMLDEFGLMMQSTLGKRQDPHKRDMFATLMTLYSSAGSVYRGTEYADQKERKRTVLQNPNACIYGTSTHSQFYAALTSSQGVDGTLSRLVVVSADTHRPERQRPTLDSPDPILLDSIKSLASFSPGGDLVGLTGAELAPQADVVYMDSPVYDAWETLDDEMTKYMVDDASRSVYSRVAENAAKLSLVYAISQDYVNPKIDAEAFKWGRELALWAANSLMYEVARHVADNETERELKKVYNVISDCGTKGISQTGLLRKVQTIKKKEIQEIVSRLLEAGQIELSQRKPKRGPVATVYVAKGM